MTNAIEGARRPQPTRLFANPEAPKAANPAPAPRAVGLARDGLALSGASRSGIGLPAFEANRKAPPRKAEEPWGGGKERYKAWEAQKRRELATAIKNDPEIQAGLARFDKMTPKEKLALGEKIAAHMGRIYGFQPAKMELASNRTLKGSHGSHEPGDAPNEVSQAKIELNRDMLHNDPKRKEPERMDAREFVDTIVHEQAHQFQNELVHGKDRSADDPLRPAQEVYRHNEKNYHKSPGNGLSKAAYERRDALYREQAQERIAFKTGEEVADLVFGPKPAQDPRRQHRCARC